MKQTLLIFGVLIGIFASINNSLAQTLKSVDLSVDNVWVTITGSVPDNSYTDVNNPYFGGYYCIPKHLFEGFEKVAFPFGHPGNEEIIFDWQLSLVRNPQGTQEVVFQKNTADTVSVGESDTLVYSGTIGSQLAGSYGVSVKLTSENDAETSNNTAEYNYKITDTLYSYANYDSVASSASFSVFDLDGGAHGDGVGQVYYFPQPSKSNYVIKSLTVYIQDDYTQVINDGNGSIIGVVYSFDTETGKWDLQNPLFTSATAQLTSFDINNFVTMGFADGSEISQSGKYLFAVHFFNNGDSSEGGKIAMGADNSMKGANDNKCVAIIGQTETIVSGNPALFIGIEAQSVDPISETNIVSYSLPNQVSSTIDYSEHKVSVVMPQGSNITSLISTFALSTGASATVSTVAQESGVTVNDFSSPVIYAIIAQDGTTSQEWTVEVATQTTAEANIVSFSLPNQVSSTIDDGGHKVTVVMPQGTDLTSLISTFTLSIGASATVSTVTQESGVTANNFSSPVTYTVVAQDGTTSQDWQVNVSTQSQVETDILTFAISGQVQSTIDKFSHNVSVLMPQGTDLTSLSPTFTLSDGATASVLEVEQVSGVTSNDFTNPVTYKIVGSDNVTMQNWTVIVTQMTTSSTAIISYSIENESYSAVFDSDTIKVYMPEGTDVTQLIASFTLATGASAKVSGVVQQSGVTSNDFTDTVTYTVTAFDGTTTKDWKVVVNIYVPGAGDFLAYSIVGQYSSTIDPGTHNIYVEVFDNLDVTNLIAQFTLPEGASAFVGSGAQESGITANDFTNPVQYQVNTAKNIVFWTVTVLDPLPANAAKILSFKIPNQVSSIINEQDKTISVVMPSGTNLSSLVSTYELSKGADATVDGNSQISGETANDFTSVVTYKITSPDGNTEANYIVSVSSQSSDAKILSYSISGQIGESVINSTNSTVKVTMPYGTELTNLIAQFALSVGATASVNDIEQVSGETVNDFSSDITYHVVASDGSTTANWIVTVINEVPTPDILTFELVNQVSSTINLTSATVDVVMPYGVDLSALVASFTLHAGAIAVVSEVLQESGVTVNDFTNPVTYQIFAQNGEVSKNWIVSVTTTAPGYTDILNYNIDGNIDTLDIQNAYIRVEMPSGTNLNSLIATFILSPGATAKVSGVAQVSGVTNNDFSSFVKYTIYGSNGLTKEWIVDVVDSENMSSNDNILSFTFYGQTNSSEVDETSRTVNVNIKSGIDQSKLIPVFYLSNGARAYVGEKLQRSGKTINDFSSSVIYKVIAQDNIHFQDWTINVTNNQNANTDITSFSFKGIAENNQRETIYSNTHFIEASVAWGISRDSLVAEFALSPGATVKVSGIEQESGVSYHNFNLPVVYTVTAQDATTTVEWKVSVGYFIGIESVKDAGIELFPNPIVNNLHVKLPFPKFNGEILISDISGRIVYAHKLTEVDKILNLSSLKEGAYIVIVKNGTEQWFKRIVKK